MFIFSVRKVPKQTNHCFHPLVTKRKMSVMVLFKLFRIITDFFLYLFYLLRPHWALLTVLAAVYLNLRTLLRRDHPLCFPRPRGPNAFQLILEHRSRFGRSTVTPGGGGMSGNNTEQFSKATGCITTRHVGPAAMR